jgi:ribosomal protein S18 acetylase RimI-like enzyme
MRLTERYAAAAPTLTRALKVLDVLTVNQRAQALYQRLGTKEVARHGHNNIKITMRSTRPRR